MNDLPPGFVLDDGLPEGFVIDAAPAEPPPSPTGTGFENFAAGVGRGVMQAGYGVKEALDGAASWLDKNVGSLNAPGFPTPQQAAAATQGQIEEAKRLDQPLLATREGSIGSDVGQIATSLPLLFAPGANSLIGASLAGAAQGGLLAPGSLEERSGKAASGAAFGAGGYAAGKAIQAGAKGLLGRMSNKAAEGAAKGLPRDETLAIVQREGYVLPPTQASENPGWLTRAAEGFAGKLTTAQAASIKNQEVTDTLARRAIGLEGRGPITADELDLAKAPAMEAYKKVSLLSPDAKDAVGAWRQANFEAKAQGQYYARSANPAAQKAAAAAKSEAKEWQGLLEAEARKAGAPELIDELTAARMRLAKIGTVEKALNEATGSVNARVLAQDLKKGKPLTGELRDIAKVAGAFPKATAEVRESMPGISPLDFAVGTMSAASDSGAGWGLLLGRPLVRAGLLSRPVQAMTVAPSYAPNRLAQASAKALQGPLLPGLLGYSAANAAIQR